MTNLQRIEKAPTRPDRPADSHKGTYGTVVIVGGSLDMIGAPALAAGSALRVGCGLAQLAVPRAILPHCLCIEPSATGHGFDYDQSPAEHILGRLKGDEVLAIGPGMERGRPQQLMLRNLLRSEHPIVLDADGLNNLTALGDPAMARKHPGSLILTPHPGEYKRLAELHGIDENPTDPDERPTAAAKLAQACEAIVVLKGMHTIVTDAERLYVNQTGNPALATAGTGDVLTGAIASLLAQGMSPFDAAALGVYLHGAAADRWAERVGPVGLTARGLSEMLPETLVGLS